MVTPTQKLPVTRSLQERLGSIEGNLKGFHSEHELRRKREISAGKRLRKILFKDSPWYYRLMNIPVNKTPEEVAQAFVEVGLYPSEEEAREDIKKFKGVIKIDFGEYMYFQRVFDDKGREAYSIEVEPREKVFDYD